MQVLIITPAPPGSVTGNRIHACRWARLLRRGGHQVRICQRLDEPRARTDDSDCLIGLHARHSSDAVDQFHQRFPARPIVVCLTGTDLHGDLTRPETEGFEQASRSLELATRIVLLEPLGGKRLDPGQRAKSLVIFQSAGPLKDPPCKPTDNWLVTVIGHLRDVKDPFRAETASRMLPSRSRAVVEHIGSALEPGMAERATELTGENPRYRWIGQVKHSVARRRLAASHVTVVSSYSEGASNIISEALASEVPVLATRIDGVMGILGEDWPGLFDAGDTRGLAELMWQSESDPEFYRCLLAAVKVRASLIEPEREQQMLNALVRSLG